MALLLYMNINKFTDPIRCWSYNPRILCRHFFLPPSYWDWSTTSSRKTQIKCLFITILTTTETTTCNPSLNTDTVLGGSIWARSAEAVQERSEISHPIPTLHPDSCFQWIVAWYSWYLRAVSNRIGFQLASTEWLVDFSTATTPLDVKVKQALRGARETLHPA